MGWRGGSGGRGSGRPAGGGGGGGGEHWNSNSDHGDHGSGRTRGGRDGGGGAVPGSNGRWHAPEGNGATSSSQSGYGKYAQDGRGGQQLNNYADAAGWGGFAEGATQRPLAAQWRFVNRILLRHSPQELITEPRREICLADHIFVQYAWDFSEQHGIVCSAGEDEGHTGKRRSDKNSEDSHWVVHWVEDLGRLQCTSLSAFAKGGELYRVSYPCWACQCYLPATSTMKPHILDEYYLEAEPDDAVAKQANNAYRNGGWRPNWDQACDLEFCVDTKTFGRGRHLEVHSRRTSATVAVAPLGFLVRGGSKKPSELFAAGYAVTSTSNNSFSGASLSAERGYSGSPSSKPPPPGFPGQGGQNPSSWQPVERPGGQSSAPRMPLQVTLASELEAYQHERYHQTVSGAVDNNHNAGSFLPETGMQVAYDASQGGWDQAQPWFGGLGDGGLGGIPPSGGGGAAASMSMSANAQVFVPSAPPQANWEGLYQ